MKRTSCLTTAAALLAGFALTNAAAAEEPVTTGPTVAPVAIGAAPAYASRDVVTREEVTPNGALIASGTLMLGLSYGGSVIVAATSDRGEDDHLLVPLAGPWIDLADRGPCRVTVASCDAETTNKVLLVADGIFQGLGALQIVGGFLFPTRTIVTEAKGPSVRVAPSVGLGRYGLSAAGTF